MSFFLSFDFARRKDHKFTIYTRKKRFSIGSTYLRANTENENVTTIHGFIGNFVQVRFTKTCPCNIQRFFFSVVKIENFIIKNDIFLYLCSKYRLWVNEAVQTSIHNLCFGAIIRTSWLPSKRNSFKKESNTVGLAA